METNLVCLRCTPVGAFESDKKGDCVVCGKEITGQVFEVIVQKPSFKSQLAAEREKREALEAELEQAREALKIQDEALEKIEDCDIHECECAYDENLPPNELAYHARKDAFEALKGGNQNQGN